jgi:hypothetical protein
MVYHTKLSRLQEECAELKRKIMNSDADCVKELKQEYIKKASSILCILHKKSVLYEEENKTDNAGEQNLPSVIQ